MPSHALSATVVCVSLLAPAVAAAQPVTPPNWKWVTDRPATLVIEGDLPEGGWHFVEMAPGWHVTMGPGGILYDPAVDLRGRFVVEAEIFLFPQPSEAGYGVFAGGTRLDADDRSYFAFLARADGSAGIFHHAGSAVHTLIDWTRNEAILPRSPDDAVKNVLRVEAEMDSVRFSINGTRVATLPRPDNLDGLAGLRIGEGVNVHASNLDVTSRLAPPRPVRR